MKDISVIIALFGFLTAATNLLSAAIHLITEALKEQNRKNK